MIRIILLCVILIPLASGIAQETTLTPRPRNKQSAEDYKSRFGEYPSWYTPEKSVRELNNEKLAAFIKQLENSGKSAKDLYIENIYNQLNQVQAVSRADSAIAGFPVSVLSKPGTELTEKQKRVAEYLKDVYGYYPLWYKSPDQITEPETTFKEKEKKYKVVGWQDPEEWSKNKDFEDSKLRVMAQDSQWKGTNQALLDSAILHKAYNVEGYSIYEPALMKKERLARIKP